VRGLSKRRRDSPPRGRLPRSGADPLWPPADAPVRTAPMPDTDRDRSIQESVRRWIHHESFVGLRMIETTDIEGKTMASTKMLRTQLHRFDILLDDLYSCIETYRGPTDAYGLSIKLARLAGLLRTHFAMANEVFYPHIIGSGDREAMVMAQVFRSELINIRWQFNRFMQRWLSSDEIARSFKQFSYEAGMLLGAIRERNEREKRDLFPMAEALPTRPSAAQTPRLPRAAAASSTSSAMISATGSSRLTMPTD
jgi:hypothetical protein